MINKFLLIICTILLTSTSAMASSGWIIFYESAFKGKVIDSETREPIEGAVVAAIYEVSILGLFHSGSAYADVQEALTDSNGEFTIPGNIFFYPWPLSGGERTGFVIFKPGYGTYPGFYDFLIYPINETEHLPEGKIVTGGKVVKTLKARTVHTEGIVYEKSIKDKNKWKSYNKKFNGSSPFIPLENPFEKVHNLDLPFDADVMNAEQIWTSRDPFGTFPSREPFKSYVLIGLPKAKTTEERKTSHRRSDKIPPRFENKVPLWNKTLDDEYNFIFKEVR